MAAWSSTTTYALDDLVTYGGINYYSLANDNLNNEPDLNVGTWWGYIVAVSKLAGYSVLFPQLQVSKLTGYSVLFPQLQVSKLTAYAVLIPAGRFHIFKASFP